MSSNSAWLQSVFGLQMLYREGDNRDNGRNTCETGVLTTYNNEPIS